MSTDPQSSYVPQPGDIVSVRGVVTPYAKTPAITLGNATVAIADCNDITLTERPVPPEPDWAVGDVVQASTVCDLFGADLAENDDKFIFVNREDSDEPPWLRIATGRYYRRDELGTLTPCDITLRPIKPLPAFRANCTEEMCRLAEPHPAHPGSIYSVGAAWQKPAVEHCEWSLCDKPRGHEGSHVHTPLATWAELAPGALGRCVARFGGNRCIERTGHASMHTFDTSRP